MAHFNTINKYDLAELLMHAIFTIEGQCFMSLL